MRELRLPAFLIADLGAPAASRRSLHRPPATRANICSCGLPALRREGAPAPARDPDFNTADLPMLLRIGDLPALYRLLFLGGA